MPFQFTCSNCHRPYTSPSRRERRFCSLACKYEADKHRRNHVCARCSARFDRPISLRLARWCSRTCYNADKNDAANAPERFWSKVTRTIGNECWLWTGSRSKEGGYGQWGSSRSRHRGSAHRRAWELASGSPIPKGLIIGHTCDTPACVRNEEAGVYVIRGRTLPRWGHLFLGTTADNMADKGAKGRGRNAYGGKYPRAHEATLYFRELLAGVWIPIVVLAEIRVLPGTTAPAPNKYTRNA